MNPIDFTSSTFELKVEKCTGSPECADNNEIEKVIFDFSNFFQIFTET